MARLLVIWRKLDPVFRWLLRMLLAMLPVIAPAVAFLAAGRWVQGDARLDYFELEAQILPIVLLALAIEQRYWFRRPRLPALPARAEFQASVKGLPRKLRRPVGTAQYHAARALFLTCWVGAYLYPAIILAVLAIGELACLKAVAVGHPEEGDLQASAGALAGGITALLASAVGGATETRKTESQRPRA